jgi:hypothetical protein
MGADGRLTEAQAFGGTGQVSLVRDGNEGLEVMKLHGLPWHRKGAEASA